jgi:hypothetical protein
VITFGSFLARVNVNFGVGKWHLPTVVLVFTHVRSQHVRHYGDYVLVHVAGIGGGVCGPRIGSGRSPVCE